LQLLSLLLYAKFSTGKQVSDTGSDLLDAIAVNPREDEVDSEEVDDEELLAGIDDENVREAFRVCSSYSRPFQTFLFSPSYLYNWSSFLILAFFPFPLFLPLLNCPVPLNISW